MPRCSIFFVLLIFLINANSAYATLPARISGLDLAKHTQVSLATAPSSDKKANVFIFLSAKCPCSNSHISLIREMALTFREFNFYGIHSNLDEQIETVEEYFKKQNLPFKIIKDTDTKIADFFKAYKTPHAFVIDSHNQIVYQGGITNSSHGDRADRIYLREALEDLQNNRAIKTSDARTLGCVIMRKKELPQ